MKHNSFDSGVLSIVSRSDYDDMPSNGSGKRGKGNKGLTLGVLICILIVLIIIVVRLIVSPDEQLEVLPPNEVKKNTEVTTSSDTATVETSLNQVLEINTLENVDNSLTTEETSDSVLFDNLSTDKGGETRGDIISTEELVEKEEEIIKDIASTIIEEELMEEDYSRFPLDNMTKEEGNDLLSESVVSGEVEVETSSLDLVVEEIENDEPLMEETEGLPEEEPLLDESGIEESLFDESSIEEPIIDEPIIDEPIIDEPIIEEPIVEEPIVEEPIVEEPIVEEPIVEEPIVEEPISEEVVVEYKEEGEEEFPSQEVSAIEELAVKPEETEVIPFDPFPRESAEGLRNGLGELLSKLNFNLIFKEESNQVNNADEIEIQETEPADEYIESEIVDLDSFQEPIDDFERVEDTLESEEVVFDENENNEVIVDEEEESQENTSSFEEETVYDSLSNVIEIYVPNEEIIPESEKVVEGNIVKLIGKPGSAVNSPVDGNIVLSTKINGEKVISIEVESGEVLTFSGFERVIVKKGQVIKKGSVLGSIGSSNSSVLTISLKSESDVSFVFL